MMKKLILLFLTCLICISSKANPIMVPTLPIINEIYFDTNQNWIIELNTWFYDDIDFNNITIETGSGSSGFKPGIITTNSFTLITKDSLVTPLFIDPNGDYIRIVGIDNYIKSEYYFYFGNILYSNISPINSTQSYVMQVFDNFSAAFFYNLVKETIPTIGSINNPNPPIGVLTGQIIDCDSIPIPDVKIICKITSYNYEIHPVYDSFNYGVYLYYNLPIQSDANGNFFNNTLYARDYDLNFYSKDGNYQYDTTISVSIEPDSVNNFYFVLDTTRIFVGVNHFNLPDIKFSVFPNPVSDLATISCNIGNDITFRNAVIKIFTSNGDLIKIIPFPPSNINTERNIPLNLSKFSSGNYYCNLDIDGKKVASNKIVIIK